MKAFDLFFPDVLPDAPGVTEPIAEHALLRAAQRFCQLTRAWRVVLDPTTTIAGIDEYDLELPRDTELVRIESAKLGGNDVEVATKDNASRLREYVFCPDGQLLYVNPVPAGSTVIQITATLMPGNGAIGIEDFLYDRYVSVIAAGAVAKLMQQPMKPYSSAEGIPRWAAFEARCASIRNSLWRGLANNSPRAVANFF